MLRQLTSQGLRAVTHKQGRCLASLAAAEACELSAPGSAVDRAIPSPDSAETPPTYVASYLSAQELHRLPPRPTARLEIWRHCSTASAAMVAQRPVVLLTRAASLETISAPTRKHSAASKAAAQKSKKAGPSKTKKATRAKKSARGSVVTARRQSTTQNTDTRKTARELVKTRVAAVKAREAERSQKLREKMAEVKTKADQAMAAAVAKVKAEGDAKLRAALAKAEARLARAEAKAKDKERAKRAPSALNLYVREQMKANPLITMRDAVQRFRALPELERAKYIDAAAAAKVEVERQREQLAKERGARRAVSAYSFFATEQRPAVRAASPNASLVEVSKRLGQMWRGLGAEERQRYNDMSEADRKAKGLPPAAPSTASVKAGSTTEPVASAQSTAATQ